MIVSITKAAQLAGVSRTTLYDKINGGEISRTPDGIDTSELIRVFGELHSEAREPATEAEAKPAPDNNISRLLDRLESKDDKIERLEIDLGDLQHRLEEHREAARALISPDDFETKIQAERERLEQEKVDALALKQQQHEKALKVEREQQAKAVALEKQASEKLKLEQSETEKKWKTALADRKLEIKQARAEADQIRQREADQAKALKAERDRVAALESRGFIARLMNKKPSPVG